MTGSKDVLTSKPERPTLWRRDDRFYDLLLPANLETHRKQREQEIRRLAHHALKAAAEVFNE
jgi:hypothetical protein